MSDVLTTVEQVNGLGKYRRTQDEEYWYWGEFKNDNFQVRVKKSGLLNDSVEGDIRMNLFGRTVERPFSHSDITKRIGECGSETLHKGANFSEVKDILPPADVLELASMQKFQIDMWGFLAPCNVITVDFGKDTFCCNARVYDTASGYKIIKDVLKYREGLVKLCFVGRGSRCKN